MKRLNEQNIKKKIKRGFTKRLKRYEYKMA